MSSSHERGRPTGGVRRCTRLGLLAARRSGSLGGWTVGSTRANSRMPSSSWDPPAQHDLSELLLPKGRGQTQAPHPFARWFQRRSRSRNMTTRENKGEGLRAENAGRKPRATRCQSRWVLHPRMAGDCFAIVLPDRTDRRVCCSNRAVDFCKVPSTRRAFRSHPSHLIGVLSLRGREEQCRTALRHFPMTDVSFPRHVCLATPPTDRGTRR